MAQDLNDRLIWFIAGGAIGAALALLYAPASGSDTRKYLGEKTREGSHALADTSKEMYERGRDLYERGRKLADEAADMLERGRNIVEKAAEAAVQEAKAESNA
jgi:gas vesicle protein